MRTNRGHNSNFAMPCKEAAYLTRTVMHALIPPDTPEKRGKPTTVAGRVLPALQLHSDGNSTNYFLHKNTSPPSHSGHSEGDSLVAGQFFVPFASSQAEISSPAIFLLQAISLCPAILSLRAESFDPRAIVACQFLHTRRNRGCIDSTNIGQDGITSSSPMYIWPTAAPFSVPSSLGYYSLSFLLPVSNYWATTPSHEGHCCCITNAGPCCIVTK